MYAATRVHCVEPSIGSKAEPDFCDRRRAGGKLRQLSGPIPWDNRDRIAKSLEPCNAAPASTLKASRINVFGLIGEEHREGVGSQSRRLAELGQPGLCRLALDGIDERWFSSSAQAHEAVRPPVGRRPLNRNGPAFEEVIAGLPRIVCGPKGVGHAGREHALGRIADARGLAPPAPTETQGLHSRTNRRSAGVKWNAQPRFWLCPGRKPVQGMDDECGCTRSEPSYTPLDPRPPRREPRAPATRIDVREKRSDRGGRESHRQWSLKAGSWAASFGDALAYRRGNPLPEPTETCCISLRNRDRLHGQLPEPGARGPEVDECRVGNRMPRIDRRGEEVHGEGLALARC